MEQLTKESYLTFDDEKILEQIFDNGYATIDLNVIPNKLSVTVRSEITQDYEYMQQMISSLPKDTNQITYLQNVAVWRLSSVLKSVLYQHGDVPKIKNFNSPEEASKWIILQSPTILDIILQLRTQYEKHIKAILNVESIESYFFDETGSRSKPEQSPKELVSESQDPSEK